MCESNIITVKKNKPTDDLPSHYVRAIWMAWFTIAASVSWVIFSLVTLVCGIEITSFTYDEKALAFTNAVNLAAGLMAAVAAIASKDEHTGIHVKIPVGYNVAWVIFISLMYAHAASDVINY